MSTEKDGGPAFPVTDEDHRAWGISMRDYFAVHATIESDEVGVGYAAEVVGREMPRFTADPLGNSAFWAEYRAIMRYIEADAMLAARSKP